MAVLIRMIEPPPGEAIHQAAVPGRKERAKRGGGENEGMFHDVDENK